MGNCTKKSLQPDYEQEKAELKAQHSRELKAKDLLVQEAKQELELKERKIREMERKQPKDFINQALELLQKDLEEKGPSDETIDEARFQLLLLLEEFEVQALGVERLPRLSKVIKKARLDETTKRWLSEYTQSERLSDVAQQQQRGHVKGSIIIPRAMTLAELDTWDFDVYAHTPQVLQLYCFKMLEGFGLISRFEIAPDTLHNFLSEIAGGYHPNPYHNFFHGVDVMHCVFMFLRQSEVVRQARLRSLDLLGVLISAVAHDVGHNGTNNPFHVNAGTELALTYNDQSVLENFHAATLFKILQRDECNILSKVARPDYLQFRKQAIGSILATDMANHFTQVAKVDELFKALNKACSEDKTSLDAPPQAPGSILRSESSVSMGGGRRRSAEVTSTLSRAELQELMNILVHSADISNPFKPWSIAKAWALRVNEEFLLQGDQEREKGLPISPFMDRKQQNLPQMSLGFIDFIVAPLLSALVTGLPGLTQIARNLVDNRQQWHKLLIESIDEKEKKGEDAEKCEEERRSLVKRAAKFEETFSLVLSSSSSSSSSSTSGSSSSSASPSSSSPSTASSSSSTSSSSTSSSASSSSSSPALTSSSSSTSLHPTLPRLDDLKHDDMLTANSFNNASAGGGSGSGGGGGVGGGGSSSVTPATAATTPSPSPDSKSHLYMKRPSIDGKASPLALAPKRYRDRDPRRSSASSFSSSITLPKQTPSKSASKQVAGSTSGGGGGGMAVGGAAASSDHESPPHPSPAVAPTPAPIVPVAVDDLQPDEFLDSDSAETTPPLPPLPLPALAPGLLRSGSTGVTPKPPVRSQSGLTMSAPARRASGVPTSSVRGGPMLSSGYIHSVPRGGDGASRGGVMRRRSDSAAVGVHFTIDHKSLESPASHASNLAERMMMFDTPESPERNAGRAIGGAASGGSGAAGGVPRDIAPELASLVRPPSAGGSHAAPASGSSGGVLPPSSSSEAKRVGGAGGVSKSNLTIGPTPPSPSTPTPEPPERRPSESESSAFVTMHMPDAQPQPQPQPQNRPR